MIENRNKKKPAQGVVERLIEPDLAGQRIDNFLLTVLKGVPRSHIYRILRKGEVRVNRGRVKPQYRLQAGDRVRIPPLRLAPAKTPPRVDHPALARLQARVLYEDKDLLVVNKPAGMAVHGGSGVDFGVIEALRQLYPRARRLELVHRLDRDTSGCLVVAKKTSVLRSLHEALRGEGMEKRYLALVAGRFAAGETVVDRPLRKNVLRSGERLVSIDAGGKPAQTVFSLQQAFAGASLLEVRLLTGRTHQIRVHAASLGHPLAADDKYGDAAFNRRMARLGLRRLFLHARSLRFAHPSSGESLYLTAPLDEDLKQLLQRLQGTEDL